MIGRFRHRLSGFLTSLRRCAAQFDPSIAGILLILLYYVCNPLFVGYFYSIPMEGNYLIVNKNLVELAALAVLAVTFSGRYAGIDRILHKLLPARSS